MTGLPSDEAVLRAVVEHDGGDYDRVKKITIGYSAVPSLIAGRVDAVVAFWNAEGVALRERGVETREFRVDDYGAPRYPELVLVVKRQTLEARGGSSTTCSARSPRAPRRRCASATETVGALVRVRPTSR